MTEEPEKQELSGRDETGKFMPGVSGNPNGRPKGLSITSLVKERLQDIPPGQEKTYLSLFIDRILKQAIVDGDSKLIDKIWAYIDGMPRQTIKSEFDDEVSEVEIKITKNETPT